MAGFDADGLDRRERVLSDPLRRGDVAFGILCGAAGFALPDGFVDLAAVQGSDNTPDQAPPAYEGAYAGIQSKKKAVRRVNFANMDNNAADFEEVNYSKSIPAEKQPHVGASVSAPPQPTFTPVETGDRRYTGFFDETSSMKAKLIARYNAGAYSADGGSAEITIVLSFFSFLKPYRFKTIKSRHFIPTA